MKVYKILILLLMCSGFVYGQTFVTSTIATRVNTACFSKLSLDNTGNPTFAYYDYETGSIRLLTQGITSWENTAIQFDDIYDQDFGYAVHSNGQKTVVVIDQNNSLKYLGPISQSVTFNSSSISGTSDLVYPVHKKLNSGKQLLSLYDSNRESIVLYEFLNSQWQRTTQYTSELPQLALGQFSYDIDHNDDLSLIYYDQPKTTLNYVGQNAIHYTFVKNTISLTKDLIYPELKWFNSKLVLSMYDSNVERIRFFEQQNSNWVISTTLGLNLPQIQLSQFSYAVDSKNEMNLLYIDFLKTSIKYLGDKVIPIGWNTSQIFSNSNFDVITPTRIEPNNKIAFSVFNNNDNGLIEFWEKGETAWQKSSQNVEMNSELLNYSYTHDQKNNLALSYNIKNPYALKYMGTVAPVYTWPKTILLEKGNVGGPISSTWDFIEEKLVAVFYDISGFPRLVEYKDGVTSTELVDESTNDVGSGIGFDMSYLGDYGVSYVDKTDGFVKYAVNNSGYLLADFDFSGRVDGYDLSVLAGAFGASFEETRYIRRVDMNSSGRIDGFDLAILAFHFNESKLLVKSMTSSDEPVTFFMYSDKSHYKNGDSVFVTFNVRDCQPLYAYNLDLGFTNVEYVDSHQTDFLNQQNKVQTFFMSDINDGKLLLAESCVGQNTEYADGDGTLLKLSFVANQSGEIGDFICINDIGLVAPDGVSRYDVVQNLASNVENKQIPKEFQFKQNYPNPFNMNTTFEFVLPYSDSPSLFIYNILGELVYDFTFNHLEPGYYKHSWNGLDLNGSACSSGIYFAKLKSLEKSFTRKITVIK